MALYDDAGLKAPARDRFFPYRLLINTFTSTVDTDRFLDPSVGSGEVRAAIRWVRTNGPGDRAPGSRFSEKVRTMQRQEFDVLNGSYRRVSDAVGAGWSL